MQVNAEYVLKACEDSRMVSKGMPNGESAERSL